MKFVDQACKLISDFDLNVPENENEICCISGWNISRACESIWECKSAVPLVNVNFYSPPV